MDTSTFQNIGTGEHFWFMFIALILSVGVIGIPVYLLLKDLLLEEPRVRGHNVFKLVLALIVVWIFWSSWGPGRELDNHSPEEDGSRRATLAGPDEKPIEVRETEAEEWKHKTQRDFSKKITNQEDPNEVLRRALEGAQQPKGNEK